MISQPKPSEAASPPSLQVLVPRPIELAEGSAMPELRQNFFTKEWVIIATERAKRPEELATHRLVQNAPAFVESCRFCVGNESKTPPEVTRFPAVTKPWDVRVIPNKFAALSSEVQPTLSLQHLRRRIEGFGFHEVIIDSPDHSCPMAMLSDAHVAKILGIYKERYNALSLDHRINPRHHLQEPRRRRGSQLATSPLPDYRDARDPQPGQASSARSLASF